MRRRAGIIAQILAFLKGSASLQLASSYAEAVAEEAESDLFNRAFRRRAAFRWIMPRFAALSIAEIMA